MVGEVTALSHEARDDAVESRALEGESAALLSSAESAEVLGRLGDSVGICVTSGC